MKILDVFIENFKNITNFHKELDGRSVFIIGKNGRGKSSLIQAIWLALNPNDVPDIPVTEGEEQARIVLKIGNEDRYYNVTRKFGKGKGLVVENEEGAKFASPQSTLDAIIGKVAFDPFKFAAMDGKKKVEYIKKTINIDTTAEEEEYDKVYKERTELNSNATIHQGTVTTNEYYIKIKDEYKGDELKNHILTHKIEKVDSLKLQEEIKEIEDFNKKITDATASISTLQDNNKSKEKEVAELEKLVRKLNREIAANCKEVTDLKKIEAKKPKDATDKKEKLTNISESERERLTLESLKKSYKLYIDAKTNSTAKTERLEEIKADIATKIKESDMPQGFTFEGDELMYLGRPYHTNQLNTAEIWKTSIPLMKAINGDNKLGIIYFDASLIDEDNIKIMMDMLEEEDLQAFIEKVTSDDKLRVEFEEDFMKEQK